MPTNINQIRKLLVETKDICEPACWDSAHSAPRWAVEKLTKALELICDGIDQSDELQLEQQERMGND